MPPPMTTARACAGSSATLLPELLPALLEALQTVARIAGVVEIDGGGKRGDRAPQRLAQQRGALHGGETARDRSFESRTKITGQELRLQLGSERVVGRQIGQIEQRAVEPGVVPVDEPQPLTIIDEIGSEQIVVAKHDRDRPDGELELPRDFRQFVEFHGVGTLTPRLELAQVLAYDLEHPEHQRRPLQVARYLLVTAAQQLHDALELVSGAHILRP